ncbi:MAG: pyridoxal phosphate-dependent aminotransferase [Deltaproteobacteria bacterium]|jgi:aspartate aminotransferase|nr:pyridoxal phosphate-dependent aminotransferase [Deltaproteobacteria bacterium]
MLISTRMSLALQSGSMVRKMFEEGIRLKAEHGKDKVFDYSLGNPDLPPPESFVNALRSAAVDGEAPGVHGYMPNGGWPDVREAVAEYLTAINPGLGVPFGGRHVVMTVGAAGAMNCVLKALLDPGDEVIALAPYFMEYGFYADNHGGVLKPIQTDEAFRPDPDRVLAAVTPRTRALIVNTPNNPTGAVYSEGELHALGEALDEAGRIAGRPVFLISDEPYRKIVFGGLEAPSVFSAYRHSIAVTSFSKDLSIPGERLGYAAVSPLVDGAEELVSALVLANRILGSVNAPSLMQRVVKGLLRDSADLSVYETRSGILAEALAEAGYELTRPQGTFYLFPRSPVPDDMGFAETLRDELILAVPGSGFGRPGHFRLSLCLDEKMIRKSIPAFTRARKRAAG